MGGNSQSKATSYRKPTTSTGFLGRGRHVEPYYRRYNFTEITAGKIGMLMVQLLGNEGNHKRLNDNDMTTLRFFRAAHAFIPDAEDDGADLENAAFILRQPGRELAIIAGDGDWEYDFCEESDGEIYGRNIRKPLLRYVYDGAKGVVKRFFSAALGLLSSPLKMALGWH